jgi:hypothetical protein
MTDDLNQRIRAAARHRGQLYERVSPKPEPTTEERRSAASGSAARSKDSIRSRCPLGRDLLRVHPRRDEVGHRAVPCLVRGQRL